MKKTLFALNCLLLSFGLLVTVSHGRTPPQSGASKVVMVETVSKPVKGKAVNFTWKDGDRTVSFADFTAGKVVLLNIWATWCGPCKREIPDLIEISKEMAPKGVIVMGVSVDDREKAASVRNYVEKVGIPYPIILDNLQISEAYGGVSAIPATFIIDRQGNVINKIVGMMTKDQFVQALSKAF